MNAENKRGFPRYKVRGGDFAFYTSQDKGSIRDASRCGVYIEDPQHRFSKDSVIDIELHLGSEAIAVHALVTRSDPGEGFAVEFLTAPNDIHQRLENYFGDLGTIT